MSEIHGSWFDPSNPVVRYEGLINERDWARLEDDTETADLVLVIGTSLSGLNADQVVTEAASRSLTGSALGAVSINLQQTPLDGKMTLLIREIRRCLEALTHRAWITGSYEANEKVRSRRVIL